MSFDELDTVDQFWEGPSLAYMREQGWDDKKKWNGKGLEAEGSSPYTDDTTGTDLKIGKWGCQWSPKYEDQLMSMRLADSIGFAVS